MEEEYWERFAETGRVDDYLHYKGMALCRQVMAAYQDEPGAAGHVSVSQTGGKNSESDYIDGHGAAGGTYR